MHHSLMSRMQVMLLGFVLLGRCLEEKARLKASSDMNEILSLLSSQSRLVVTSLEADPSVEDVLSSDAVCVEVPTDNVRVGDTVLVLPGETIPVDGKVLAGRSDIIEESQKCLANEQVEELVELIANLFPPSLKP
ncbi:hypothetical protein MKX01_036461 [Papaver californicum]|nr:hypothetical protein MKX01_036461 [Papaver californicum]